MFVESALVYGGLMGFGRIYYQNFLAFKFPPELWRLLSAFLLTGPDFSFVIDLYLSKLKDGQAVLLPANYIQRIHMPQVWN